jgi:hypothetical protein
MANAVQYLIEWYREQPPLDARQRARQLREIWLAYPSQVRAEIRKEHGTDKPRFPELSIPAPLIDVSNVLLDAEGAGQDVTECWKALNDALPPDTVHRALQQARASYAENFHVPFATHLACSFDEIHFESLDAPSPRQMAVVGLNLPYDEMEVRWLKSRAQLHRQPVGVYIMTALKRDADRFDATRSISTTASPQARSPATVQPKPTFTPGPLYRVKNTKPPPPQRAARPKAEPDTSKEKGPALYKKLKIVMGKKAMTIPETIAALRAHNKAWVPKSNDLNAYISLVLSTHINTDFVRVKRGVYRVLLPSDVENPHLPPDTLAILEKAANDG